MGTHDLRDHLKKIDRQIFDLIAERVARCQEAKEQDEETFDAESQTDTIAEWEEMADEKGWNLSTVNRIAKGILDVCKSGND
ncbi:chorismate mutase [Candidatus Peregrinibacteria bacterium]|nr:chorismate mutase [Candidatus Peregrinibacteria bacterium]MBI3816309.1 chorismate mutase [Candidatus Peregrinibacteria bacterium]